MTWIRLDGPCSFIYVPIDKILSIELPVDSSTSKKPPGWIDGVAAQLTVGTGEGIQRFALDENQYAFLCEVLGIGEKPIRVKQSISELLKRIPTAHADLFVQG